MGVGGVGGGGGGEEGRGGEGGWTVVENVFWGLVPSATRTFVGVTTRHENNG